MQNNQYQYVLLGSRFGCFSSPYFSTKSSSNVANVGLNVIFVSSSFGVSLSAFTERDVYIIKVISVFNIWRRKNNDHDY